MHILQIAPQLPFPPDSGGRSGIFNFVQYFSRKHTITLLSFVTEKTEGYVNSLTPYCDVVPVRHTKGNSYPAMLRNLASKLPYAIEKYQSSDMVEEIRSIAGSGDIDLVHIDHLHMAQYIDALPDGLPVVLREHNVESVIMRRYSEKMSNPLKRLYAGIQARRLHAYEAVICPRFICCVPVTDVDGKALRDMAPDARIDVISSGVDTEWFDPAADSPWPDPHRIVTTGDYGWPPTADGLRHLVNEIYPKIRQEIPDVKLSIVGQSPPKSVNATAKENGIDVLGRVDDIRPEILRSSVFVVPTRIGSGIRLKILEAMAMRRPVVSTSVGCEGIDAVPEVDILVADDPEMFAASVVQLLRDQARAADIADSAAALIQRRYAWSILTTQFDRLYRSLAG